MTGLTVKIPILINDTAILLTTCMADITVIIYSYIFMIYIQALRDVFEVLHSLETKESFKLDEGYMSLSHSFFYGVNLYFFLINLKSQS